MIDATMREGAYHRVSDGPDGILGLPLLEASRMRVEHSFTITAAQGELAPGALHTLP